MNVRKLAAAAAGALVVVGAFNVVPAHAGTTNVQTYKADLKGYMNKSTGTAEVFKYRFAQPGTKSYTGWGANVQIKGLPAGDYKFVVPVVLDADHDGKADQGAATNVEVCSFHSNGVKDQNGCGAEFKLPKNAMLAKSSADVWSSVTTAATGSLKKVNN